VRVARRAWLGIALVASVGGARAATAQFGRPNPCTLLSPSDIEAVTRQTMADPQLSSDMMTCRIASYQEALYSVVDTGASVTVQVEPAGAFEDDFWTTAGPTRQPFVGLGQGAIAVTDTVPLFKVKQRNWVYTITYRTGSAVAIGVPAQVDAERRLALRLLTRAP
jgi:hypothetical protein